MKANTKLIEGPVLTECIFKLKKEKKKGVLKVNYNVGLNLNYQSKDQVVIIEMTVKIRDPKLPIDLQITATAIFEIIGDLTEKMSIKLTCINGGPILYIFLREIIADLTRKANLPPLYISPMDFEEMYRRILSQMIKSNNKS